MEYFDPFCSEDDEEDYDSDYQPERDTDPELMPIIFFPETSSEVIKGMLVHAPWAKFALVSGLASSLVQRKRWDAITFGPESLYVSQARWRLALSDDPALAKKLLPIQCLFPEVISRFADSKLELDSKLEIKNGRAFVALWRAQSHPAVAALIKNWPPSKQAWKDAWKELPRVLPVDIVQGLELLAEGRDPGWRAGLYGQDGGLIEGVAARAECMGQVLESGVVSRASLLEFLSVGLENKDAKTLRAVLAVDSKLLHEWVRLTLDVCSGDKEWNGKLPVGVDWIDALVEACGRCVSVAVMYYASERNYSDFCLCVHN